MHDLTRAGAGSEIGSAVPFARLLAAEARVAVCPRHVAVLMLLAGMGVILALWMPLWPDSVFRFFTRIFHLDGWSEIVLFNNLAGFLYCLYWLGVFDLLRIYVQPLEEGYLDILLSKPVRRRDYLVAKTVPSFVVLVAMGAVAAVVHAGAMAAVGLELEPRAYAGTIAAILGFTLLLLGVANLLMLTVRDTFAALVVAFVPFMAAMLPGIVYMYRPDFYAAAPGIADVIVFPANLLWYPEVATAWGLPIAGAFGLVAAAVTALAGRALQAKDIA
jgi:hypothetical protein